MSSPFMKPCMTTATIAYELARNTRVPKNKQEVKGTPILCKQTCLSEIFRPSIVVNI